MEFSLLRIFLSKIWLTKKTVGIFLSLQEPRNEWAYNTPQYTKGVARVK